MIAAIWAAIGKIARKVLQILAGDKKGREFLLYVVGIVLFIVFLPLIVTLALFGGTSDGLPDAIYDSIPEEQREVFEQFDNELAEITLAFEAAGLSDTELSQAKTIYLSCLVGKEQEDGFYRKFTDCFLNVTSDSNLLDNISSAFGVIFSDAERQQFENLYS